LRGLLRAGGAWFRRLLLRPRPYHPAYRLLHAGERNGFAESKRRTRRQVIYGLPAACCWRRSIGNTPQGRGCSLGFFAAKPAPPRIAYLIASPTLQLHFETDTHPRAEAQVCTKVGA
jgi:hypothetical protein